MFVLKTVVYIIKILFFSLVVTILIPQVTNVSSAYARMRVVQQ